jgi:hypothetical protein
LQSYNDVINQKPGHRYVLAAVNDERGGAMYYEYVLGYSPVIYDEKDPKCTRLRAGRWKHGEPVMMGMQKLMELAPDKAADLDAVGYNGQTGQAFADKIEEQILGRGGIEAPRQRNSYFTQESMAKRDDLADTSDFLGGA